MDTKSMAMAMLPSEAKMTSREFVRRRCCAPSLLAEAQQAKMLTMNYAATDNVARAKLDLLYCIIKGHTKVSNRSMY